MKKTTGTGLEWLGNLFRDAIRGMLVDGIKWIIRAILLAVIYGLSHASQVEDSAAKWRLVLEHRIELTTDGKAVGPLAPLLYS